MTVEAERSPAGMRERPQASFLNDARVRGVAVQILVAVCVALFVWWVTANTIANLQRMRMAAGFDFLDDRAGFPIAQVLIPYTPDSTYFQAFLVGLVNTLVVAVAGIILASIIGFLVGIARLSPNWLLARMATVYVETLRNIPLLLQLFFWYQAVLRALPDVRAGGIALPFGANLNQRGLYLPKLIGGEGIGLTWIALLVAVAAAVAIGVWSRRRQAATGRQFPALWTGLGLVVGLPLLVFLVTGMPVTADYPVLGTFNFQGGWVILPELAALLLGLTLYTATYIAEVVRAGILSVSHGQTEAARALGLQSRATMRLVIVPQAMRVIIPPLTNQYLNLTKNSSLAVAIGYPDLVGVFKNTVLNQTGHAIEVIFMTMMVYLLLSLLTSLAMNWFNARVALKER